MESKYALILNDPFGYHSLSIGDVALIHDYQENHKSVKLDNGRGINLYFNIRDVKIIDEKDLSKLERVLYGL